MLNVYTLGEHNPDSLSTMRVRIRLSQSVQNIVRNQLTLRAAIPLNWEVSSTLPKYPPSLHFAKFAIYCCSHFTRKLVVKYIRISSNIQYYCNVTLLIVFVLFTIIFEFNSQSFSFLFHQELFYLKK